jgi:hypothetical protein
MRRGPERTAALLLFDDKRERPDSKGQTTAQDELRERGFVPLLLPAATSWQQS